MNPVTLDRQFAHDQPASLSPRETLKRGGALEAETLPVRDPQEVLRHPGLDVGAKRAILAGWVSDACAVENLPHRRKPPGTGALVALDDILDALQALDGHTLH
jgi:hypothetical protein